MSMHDDSTSAHESGAQMTPTVKERLAVCPHVDEADEVKWYFTPGCAARLDDSIIISYTVVCTACELRHPDDPRRATTETRGIGERLRFFEAVGVRQ
jgi:hypothetical protein